MLPGLTAGIPLGSTNSGSVGCLQVLWTGYLNVVTPGLYRFFDEVDDAGYVLVDGQVLITSTYSGDTLPARTNASTFLTAGVHVIDDVYANGQGGGCSLVEYTGPDTGNPNPANNNTGLTIIPGAASVQSPGFLATGIFNLFSQLAPTTTLTLSGTSAGTFNIPNAQTYTGPTYLSGGIYDVGNNTSLGVGPAAVLNITGGYLQGNASITLANPISFTNAAFDFYGTQNITLSGNATLTGVNTVNLANFGQAVLSGTISGSGSLTVAQPPGPNTEANVEFGFSNLTITGQNTYTGGTSIVGSFCNVVAGLEQHRHDQRPLWHRPLDPHRGRTLRHCHGGIDQQPGDFERHRGLGPQQHEQLRQQ